MRRPERPRARALAVALLVVLSSIVGAVTVGTQPARADIGEEGCLDDVVVGLVIGAATMGVASAAVAYDNVRDPCFEQNNDVVDVDTEEEAKRRIAQLAMEDRRFLVQYFDAFDAHSDRLENPAYLDAKTAFISAMRNGSSEAAAITDARQAVHRRIASQQRALWSEYTAVMDTLEHLALQARDNQVANESIYIGTVSNGTFRGGYSLVNYSDRDATVDVTLSNGEKITVPAPYKTANGEVTDTLHPIDDAVAVTVYNPETGVNETIINDASYTRTLLDTNPGDSFSRTFAESVASVEAEISNGRYGTASVAVGQYRFDGGRGRSWELFRNGTLIQSWASSANAQLSMSIDGDGNPTFSAKGTSYQGTDPLTNQTVTIDVVGRRDDVENLVVEADSEFLDTYSDEFESRHAQLEIIDDNVIDALGNHTDGYLHDVSTSVDLGAINYSDVYTPYDRYRQSVEPSDVGEQSWLSYQYLSLGYGGSNVSDTVEVTILAGSVVDGSTITANKTVDGHLFTDATPPGGSWTAGTAYTIGNSADLGSTVYVQRTVTESYWDNGTIHYQTRGKTTSIESGEIVISKITDSDGDSVDSVDHTDRDPSPTDTTNISDRINDLQRTIEELRDQIDEDNDGNTPDGGTGGGGGGDGIAIPLPGFLPDIPLPFGSAALNLAVFALVIVAVAPILLVTTNTADGVLKALGVRKRN